MSFSFQDIHGSESEKVSFQKLKSWPPGGIEMQVSIPAFEASPCSVLAAVRRTLVSWAPTSNQPAMPVKRWCVRRYGGSWAL